MSQRFFAVAAVPVQEQPQQGSCVLVCNGRKLAATKVPQRKSPTIIRIRNGTAPHSNPLGLNVRGQTSLFEQAGAAERKFACVREDDVVEQMDFEQGGGSGDLLGHDFVFGARLGGSRRMVVDQNQLRSQ